MNKNHYAIARNLSLLMSGIVLNGMITLPVDAQIKRVTFLPTTINAPSGNMGTLSGGFTWDQGLSAASSNMVPVSDPGLTYNISFSGTGGGIGDIAGFTLTNTSIIGGSSSGDWNLSTDGLFTPNQITSSGSQLRLITQIAFAPPAGSDPTDFYAGFDLNNPSFADLVVYNSTAFDPGSGSTTYSSGNTGLLIRVGKPVPWEFSENMAVLTFLGIMGLGYIYRKKNNFFPAHENKLNQEESQNELLTVTKKL